MAKVNPGKDFENDFKQSAEKHMFTYRLRDPAASFGNNDGNENGLRFSWRNMCDFIAYSYPVCMLIECKSKAKASIPFTAIKSRATDTRVEQMAKESEMHKGLFAFVIINWRDQKNKTIAVPANLIVSFINSCGADFGLNRKSIPFAWTVEHGIEIESRLKKIHYGYDTGRFVDGLKGLP